MANQFNKKGPNVNISGQKVSFSPKPYDNSEDQNSVNLINGDSKFATSKKSTRIKNSSNNLSNDNKIRLVQNIHGKKTQKEQSNFDDDKP